ncbi:hypothetical protein DRN69_01755 [Candidatus Pacearchaeota archaeon]|nr:MAG: hypothetical protein DRN69_01755 [Candidatus Pacearchaeota archaeon]
MKVKIKGVSIEVKRCNNFQKFKGLMFASREKAKALLFDFSKPILTPIHSFFVFFPFVALWLDDKNKLLDLKLVKPFKFFIVPKKPYQKLVEIPINQRYEKVIKFLVDF